MSSFGSPIRDVVVCPWCKLRQFLGTIYLCRRCRKPLFKSFLEIPLASVTTHPRQLAQAVGDTIRALRLKRGYSQSTLASKIGTHRTHVSRIERAQVMPRLSVLARAATALGVDQLMIRLRE